MQLICIEYGDESIDSFRGTTPIGVISHPLIPVVDEKCPKTGFPYIGGMPFAPSCIAAFS